MTRKIKMLIAENLISADDGETCSFYLTNIERYLATLPWHRRLLARFFKKYKVTKEEYDEWFYHWFFN